MQTWKFKTSVFLIAALIAAPALAQPTPAQTDAIKSNCRSDYMKSCMSVPPGGQPAFDCLKRNMASLSPACQGAVNAIKPPAPAAAAPAATPGPVAPAQAPMPTAATPAPAPTVTAVPAPAPVVALAPAARTAPAPKRPTPAAVAPAAAVATTPAVAPAMPTAEQQAAIKNTCRADFMRNCRGVQPGGPEALMCLQTNAAKLSPNCQTSVAAIADSIPAASAAAATTTAAAPAKRQYLTPGIHPAVRVGRRIRERLEGN